MNPYSEKGVTISAVLDTWRALVSDRYRVRIRVIHNRKIRNYNTHKSLTLQEWETLSGNGWKPLQL